MATAKPLPLDEARAQYDEARRRYVSAIRAAYPIGTVVRLRWGRRRWIGPFAVIQHDETRVRIENLRTKKTRWAEERSLEATG